MKARTRREETIVKIGNRATALFWGSPDAYVARVDTIIKKRRLCRARHNPR